MWLQMKLARAQVGIFMLMMLLQRTPVIKYLMQFEKAATAPIAKMIRAFTVTAASAGGLHALSGATQYVVEPVSPASATIGEEFNLAFSIIDTPAKASSWKITGTIPPGLEISGLVGDNLNSEIGTITGTPTEVGTYDVIVQPFKGRDQTLSTTDSTTITINVAAAFPEIVWDPVAMRVPMDGRAQYYFESSGEVDSIQWRKDGLDIVGETGSTLVISGATLADEGLYSVALTNAGGTTVSAGASLTIDDGATSRLSNLSNRGFVGTGGNIMIPGLVILGTGGKTVIVRGLGPDLLKKDVPDVLADPELKLYKLNFTETGVKGQLLASNDDWEVGNDAVALTAEMEALGLEPLDEGSKDAAMLVTLGEGVYTFQLSGVNGTTGVGLVELFAIE